MSTTSDKYTATFSIDVVGEISGDPYKGTFKVKTRLSHRNHLERDQIRRNLLGANSDSASADAAGTAEIFAQLAVRIVDAPGWWKNAENGFELPDEAPVVAVYKAALEAQISANKGLQSAAEEAKKDLKQE